MLVTEHERFYEQIKAGFERDNPDYELEYTQIAQSEYINKMIVNLAAGAAPTSPYVGAV